MEKGNKQGLFILLSFTFFMVTGFGMIMPLVIGYYVNILGFTATKVAVALAVRQFSQQGLAILGGILADRINIKTLVSLGVFLRAIGFSLLAFANNFFILLISMTIIGLAGVLFETPYQTAIAMLTTNENRAHYYSINNTIIGVATTIGPVVGAILLNFDFKFVCFGAASCFLLTFFISLYFMPNIINKEKSIPLKYSFKLLSKDKSFLFLTLLMLIFWLPASQINISFPLKIQELTGRNDSVALIFIVYAGLTALFQYPVVSLMLRKFLPKQIVIMGILILSLSFILVPLANTVNFFLCVIALFSLGMILARPNQQNIAVSMANKNMLGLYLGVNSLGLAFGSGFGNIMGGFLFDMTKKNGMTSLPWILFSIIAFIAMLGFKFNKNIGIIKENTKSI